MKYQRKSNQGFDRFLIHEWLESCEEISATEECGKEIRKQAYQASRNGEGGKTEPANAGQKGNFTERSYDEAFLNSFYVDGDKIK